MPYPTLPCHCKRVQRLESMRYDSQSLLRQPELFVRFSHCHPNAFPSSSLAYIANLALLTTTINRRLVPCPNAVRHHQEPACSGTSDLAPAVLHVQPAASPATVALPARQKKSLRSACTRPLRSSHPTLSRESPACIAFQKGPRSPTAFLCLCLRGAIEPASQQSPPQVSTVAIWHGTSARQEVDRSAPSAQLSFWEQRVQGEPQRK
jgi:hypothetical protein